MLFVAPCEGAAGRHVKRLYTGTGSFFVLEKASVPLDPQATLYAVQIETTFQKQNIYRCSSCRLLDPISPRVAAFRGQQAR